MYMHHAQNCTLDVHYIITCIIQYRHSTPHSFIIVFWHVYEHKMASMYMHFNDLKKRAWNEHFEENAHNDGYRDH